MRRVFEIVGFTALLLAGGPPVAAASPAAPDGSSSAEPGITFASVVAPGLGSYQHNDETLRAYGFNPVDTPFMLAYGLRGRVFFESWVLGLTMLYGFGISEDADISVVPTVSTEMSFGASGGWRTPVDGLLLEADAAFRSLTVTVGSDRQGGALVYLGPALGLRLTYVVVTESPFIAVSAGYSAHIDIGDAHDNVLWEEPFDRPGTHGATVQLEFGFGRDVERRR